MRIPSGQLSIVFILLIASACTTARDPEKLVTRSLGADGVLEVVSHVPEPLPAPWILEPDLLIGVEYGEDAYMLRGPASYAILDDGTHVVLDSTPSQIRIYDPDGTFVCEIGQPGSGPTDLPRVAFSANITPVRGDSFDVWRRSTQTRIQRWTSSGEFVSVTSISQDHSLRGRIEHWDGSRLYGRHYGARRSGVSTPFHLVRTNRVGTLVDTLHYLDMARVPVTCFMIEAEMGWSILGTPLLTTDGRLCITVPYEDWVRVFDSSSGKETVRFRWEHTPDVVADTLITHYEGQRAMGMDMEAGAQWLHENLSAVGLAEAPNGEIWVQRTPVRAPIGTWTMDVFSREGIYRGRMEVPCPPESLRPFGDFLYGIGQNGDAPALIRYRLVSASDES